MMVDATNLSCFAEPHWSVIARGFDVERWFNDGQAVGTGGINMPQVVDLRVGHRHFRFASSTWPRSAQVGGGWWIDFENFHRIENFARMHGHSLIDASRLFLALPYEWSRVDRLVSAILEVPLRAYSGRGKVVNAQSESWTPVQHDPATQLYIPGLYRRGVPPHEQLYARAFPKPEIEYIAGNRRPV